MENYNVQVNYENAEPGNYECTKRPYFNYENNTAHLTLSNGGGNLVINVDKVISIAY